MFDKLKSVGRNVKREFRVYQCLMKDKRTPNISRVFLSIAIGYTLLPFDLIPDFIPVIGHLDDVIILPLLVIAALKFIPKEVVDDCRERTLSV